MPGRRQELPVGNIVYSLVGCAKVQIFKGLPVVILCTALLAVPKSEYFKGLPVGNIVYSLVGCATVQIFKGLPVVILCMALLAVPKSKYLKDYLW